MAIRKTADLIREKKSDEQLMNERSLTETKRKTRSLKRTDERALAK